MGDPAFPRAPDFCKPDRARRSPTSLPSPGGFVCAGSSQRRRCSRPCSTPSATMGRTWSKPWCCTSAIPRIWCNFRLKTALRRLPARLRCWGLRVRPAASNLNASGSLRLCWLVARARKASAATDQGAYEPLFASASSIMTNYRALLNARQTVPAELTRVAGEALRSGKNAGSKPPAAARKTVSHPSDKK